MKGKVIFMLKNKETQERIDALLEAIQAYKVWIREYEVIEENLKRVAKEYSDSIKASPETCEAVELMIILGALREMNEIKMTHDDLTCSIFNIKNQCINPVMFIRTECEKEINKQIKNEYFHGETKEEDEYI